MGTKEQEQEVCEVLRRYLTAGLVEGDIDGVLSLVSGRVMGFGMGEQGFVSSPQDMRQIMENTAREEEQVKYELEYEWIRVRFPTDDVACVCAQVLVLRTQGGTTARSGLMQSLTMCRGEGGWEIVALHASPLELTQESINAYPLRYAENSLTDLKAELQSEAFDLVMQSISGGILGAYDGNGKFPLYFVNENLLSYLGYTREEFYSKYKNDTLKIVHPGDRKEVRRKLSDSLKMEQIHEGRFRVLKKDGSSLWMLERGRASTDEKGMRVIIGVFVDVTELITVQEELKKQAEALRMSEERFRIALEKSSNTIFEYDLASGLITYPCEPGRPADTFQLLETTGSRSGYGRVSPESRRELRDAVMDICCGKPRASCVIKMLKPDGSISWERISLTAVSDEDGQTMRAVGMIEDITRQREAELAYAREEQYRRVILSDSMAVFVINFTRDRVESCQINDPRCIKAEPGQPYDEFVAQGTRMRMDPEGRREYLGLFSRLSVLEAFQQGQREIRLEYRITNLHGSDIWLQTTLRLLPDADSDEVKGFLYVTDIDESKRRELELTRLSERDPMTGLYNRAVTERRIRELLESREAIQTGVFMMIDVDHFKEINDTCGHLCGDRVLTEAARELRGIFREGDIVGRLGGDEFGVFFCGVRSKKRVEEKAREICETFAALPVASREARPLSCSIGISFCGAAVKTFEQLYEEADQALYEVKKAGRAGYRLYAAETAGREAL